MLDLNNLILNSAPITQDTLENVQLADLIDLNNLNNEDAAITTSFDSVFMELLENPVIEVEGALDDDVSAEVSNLQQASVPIEAAAQPTAELTVTLAAQGTITPTVSPAQLPVNTDDAATTSGGQPSNKPVEPNAISNLPDTSSSLASLEKNVAMTWINSESFQPPKTVIIDGQNEDRDFSLKLHDATGELVELSAPDIDIEEALSSALGILDNKQDNKTGVSLIGELVKASSAAVSETVKLLPMEQEQFSIEAPQTQVQVNNLTNKENQQIIETKTLSIPVDIGSPEWADKFSEHIVWLGQQGIKSALIKIHPEDLGPLEISIKVVKDSATVSINSHSVHARDVVSDSLPRLKDMMTEQGITLTDVHVGADTDTRQPSKEKQQGGEVFSVDGEEEIQFTPIVKKAPKGLIDYFA